MLRARISFKTGTSSPWLSVKFAARVLVVVMAALLPQPLFADMGDVTRIGDESIPFERYRLDPDFGNKTSECNTEPEDQMPWSKGSLGGISGPYHYVCNGTALAHGSDDQIHKFRTMVCRNGPNPLSARIKARAAANAYLERAMHLFRTAHGDDRAMVRNRLSIVCVDRGLKDTKPSDGPPDEGPPDDENVPDEPAPARAPASHPDSVKFTIHNKDRYKLALKFFFNGDTRTDPSGNEHYVLTNTVKQSVACSSGEKVCFGAWREGQNVWWGGGRFNEKSCENCCSTCGGDFETTLSDGGDDAGPPPAVFVLENADRYTLGVEFFSETYPGHVWPGGNQQYVLSGKHTYNLSCRAGEKICYGAWRDHQRTYWGVGHGSEGCVGCCTVCGNKTSIRLTDGGDDAFPQSGGGGSGGSPSIDVPVGIPGGGRSGGSGGYSPRPRPGGFSPRPSAPFRKQYFPSGISGLGRR